MAMVLLYVILFTYMYLDMLTPPMCSSLGVVGTVAIAVWGYKRWERRKREAEEARRRALEAGYY